MGTEMDVLAIGNYVLFKDQQKDALKENYEDRYELDQFNFSKFTYGSKSTGYQFKNRVGCGIYTFQKK